jgi:hypothetical protein
MLQVPDPLMLPRGVGQGLDEIHELSRADRDPVGRLFEEVVEDPFARDDLEDHDRTVLTVGRRCPAGRQSTNL